MIAVRAFHVVNYMRSILKAFYVVIKRKKLTNMRCLKCDLKLQFLRIGLNKVLQSKSEFFGIRYLYTNLRLLYTSIIWQHALAKIVLTFVLVSFLVLFYSVFF